MANPALSGAWTGHALNAGSLRRALSSLSLVHQTNTSSQLRRVAATATTASTSWTCAACKQAALSTETRRHSSSSSQWKARQGRDRFARDAKVMGLKSRAAFKLLELDAKHRIFRRNQVVVDLGFAPGSWSQVAVERTKPSGVVVGIDLIPAQPPRGATSIQGDFLSPQVRRLVRDVCAEQVRRRRREAAERRSLAKADEDYGEGETVGDDWDVEPQRPDGVAGGELVADRPSYIDMEKVASHDIEVAEAEAGSETDGRMVDVIISDMSEPWPQTSGFTSNTLSRPYNRLMNTSGMAFRDHAGSMDLCHAALTFASDNLKHGGHFICKFYQGAEDKLLQSKLQKMFAHVTREKPDSSRKDSKEAFFVAVGRRRNCTLADLEG